MGRPASLTAVERAATLVLAKAVYASVENDEAYPEPFDDGSAKSATQLAAFRLASEVRRLARYERVFEAAKAFRIALRDEDNDCLDEHNALFGAVDAVLASEQEDEA